MTTTRPKVHCPDCGRTIRPRKHVYYCWRCGRDLCSICGRANVSCFSCGYKPAPNSEKRRKELKDDK